ncbi:MULTISPECIES: acyl carrier protein [Paraburkholderia]|uniref:Acyl carrier protein n=3 Tax=Paraburkholderia TaxID=1822464 RepID=A0ABU9SMW2_9BURK|nr:acyl carrier protein [Paraburkholderia nodosa]
MLNQRFERHETERLVHGAVSKIMSQRGLPARELREDDRLNATLGLSSLDLAQLVFDLELTFGADPFQTLVPITSVQTVGQLVGAYLRLFDDTGLADPNDELADAQAASERRRQRRGARG